jgi:hypothetical protein
LIDVVLLLGCGCIFDSLCSSCIDIAYTVLVVCMCMCMRYGPLVCPAVCRIIIQRVCLQRQILVTANGKTNNTTKMNKQFKIK